MKVKTLLAAIILAMLSTTGYNVYAQDDDFDCREAIRNMRTEYYENNIKPQKEAWRAEIDNALSAEDKAKLEALRAEMTELRKEMYEKIKELRDSDLTRREMWTQMRDIRKEYRDKIHDIREGVRDIWEEYTELLERIRKEKYEMSEKWRDDMHNMMERFCEAHPECCEGRRGDDRRDNDRRGRRGERGNVDRDMDRGSRGFGDGNMMGEMGHHGMKGRGMNSLGNGSDNMMNIWLYDGNNDLEANTEQAMSINIVPTSLNLTTAPNPTNNITNINFNLDNSMNVKLVVTDINGNIVKVIHTGNLSSGNHSYSFNTGGLSAGTYMYHLETDNFTKTNKIIVK